METEEQLDLFGQKLRQRQKILVAALQNSNSRRAAAITGPQQSHDPDNPGSDVYLYLSYTVGTHHVWHFKFFAIYPTTITYLLPTAPSPTSTFPVVAVSPGKFLDNPTVYNEFLRHVCRKGYIVLFVDSDTGPLDCEHSRMAGEFLEGVQQTIQRKLSRQTANPPQVAWWGHSMGAKVQAIAAQMTKNRFYQRPAAVIANHFSNDKGNFCNDDALATAPNIPPTIRYSVIQGDSDDIAKTDPRALYDRMTQLNFRQLITVVTYPNLNLSADHYAPLTDPGFPVGGVTNGLDWWLYWKVAVGIFNFHFKNGSDKWGYGSERTNGGTDSAGNKVTHLAEP